MSQLTTIDPKIKTMTSREIAELVDSRHDKVKQSIERLAAKGLISQPPAGGPDARRRLDLPPEPVLGGRMNAATLYKIREQAQLAAWEAFCAGIPMTWIAA